MKKQLLQLHSGLLACFIAGLPAANAQVKEMDSVVIRENRIRSAYGQHNSNIQVIDRKQILALPVRSVTELLAYAGGVDIRQRGPWGAQADISIDGSTFDQVLVLINGVKVSDPQTGHNMLNIPLPLSAVDHIEILRGPAARAYGVNALAGAINIITLQPTENRIYAQAYAGSSFQKDTANGETYYSRGTQVTATLAGKNQSHMVSLGQDQGNGYRYNTRMESYRVLYQNQLQLGKAHNLETMGGYVSNAFGANLFYAAPNDKESKETVQTVIAAVGDTWKASERLTIAPRISLRYNKDDYIYIRQRPEVYHNIHETNVLGGELNASYRFNKGTLALGIEYRREEIASNTLGKRDRTNKGLYGEYRHFFSERLNAGAGVYVNQNSVFGTQAYPAIDAGYRFLPRWKVFASASTGQRLPTFTDLYYRGPQNIGNPDLKPETATYVEGGLQFSNNLLQAKTTVFNRRSNDFIDWTRPTAADPWQPLNYQSLNTLGASLVLQYKLDRQLGISERHQVLLNANYTWLNQEIVYTETDKMSKYAIDALRNQFTVSANTLWFRSVMVNISARYLQRVSKNDYTLLDARIGYQFKQFSLYADVANLLDVQYKEIGSVPMPGRWFTFGAKFDGLWSSGTSSKK